MLPLTLLSKAVAVVAANGLEVLQEYAPDQEAKDKMSVDLKTTCVEFADTLADRYKALDYSEKDAKHLALVSMCVMASSVMALVNSADSDKD